MPGNKYLSQSAGVITEAVSAQVSSGIDDANKIVALDATGKLSISLLPSGIGPGTGIGISAHFAHYQATPAASWMITHNLGRKPPVALFLDSDPDTVVHTDVYHPDLNTVLIEWPSPESGWVYL